MCGSIAVSQTSFFVYFGIVVSQILYLFVLLTICDPARENVLNAFSFVRAFSRPLRLMWYNKESKEEAKTLNYTSVYFADDYVQLLFLE